MKIEWSKVDSIEYDLCGKYGKILVDIVRNDANGYWSIWINGSAIYEHIPTRDEAQKIIEDELND